jgi:hypothetical protein
MMFGNGSQPQQNAAHRADTTWAKVAPGEYVRSDGTMIRRVRSGRPFPWTAFTPDGAVMQRILSNGRPIPVGGVSLTAAKFEVSYTEEVAR